MGPSQAKPLWKSHRPSAARGFAKILTPSAPSSQREGVAGFPQRRARLHAPLPRVAVGIPPLQGAEKNGSGEYPIVLSIASRFLPGRPGEPPQVFSPRRPVSSEGALVRDASEKRFRGPSPGPVQSISRDEARWVGFSSDSCGARRPGFPQNRCRSSRTGAGFLQPPGMGIWNRGQFRRSRAPWSGIAVLRADTPARNNPVLGHSGVHRCGCRTRTVRRSPRQRRR
jgi:hypothetical protein